MTVSDAASVRSPASGRIGAGSPPGRLRSPKTSWPSAARRTPSVVPTSPQPAMSTRGTRRWYRITGAASDDLCLLQPGDVVPRVPEQLGQDLLRVLSELGCRQPDLPGSLAQPHRDTDHTNGAERGVFEARHVAVRPDLGIVGQLVHRVDDADDEIAPGGEQAEPLVAWLGGERV